MASQFNDEYYNEADEDFAPPDNSDILNDEEGYDYPEENYDEEEYNYDEDQNEKNEYDQQIEEALYQYDYEDIVGGMPCRFKYRQVEKEDFGLSIDDILDAEDAELNKYVGLKSIVGYSDPSASIDVSLSDRQIKKQKKLEKKRKQLLKALAEKRQNESEKALIVPEENSRPPQQGLDSVEMKTKRKRRRKHDDNSGLEKANASLASDTSEHIKKKKKETKQKPVSAVKKRMALYS